jgi:exosortase D (VPLPA-CTERM-specific)
VGNRLTMENSMEQENSRRFNVGQWGLLAVACLLIGFIYYDGLELMVGWWEREEYSHGYMIPLVALFLAWQKQAEIVKTAKSGSLWSVVALALALCVFLMGELSGIYTVIQYAFLMALYAVILAFVGWRAMFVMWTALAYLIFMIPLPNFLYNTLSNELQLISSTIGVMVIRLFDISVYLEGNVIDLGSYKLQVVEACSGLRYLFPLMSFGFLMACVYRGPAWQKVVLFLSTMPITILMNSFRIGVIGVMVEHWGISAAEGFLHDFEGWVIFVACLAILTLEMWLFWRLRGEKAPFIDSLDLSYPTLSEATFSSKTQSWHSNKPLLACVVLLVGFAAYASTLVERQEDVPLRKEFVQFPLFQGNWIGREDYIAPDVLDTLKLSDYFIANYRQDGNPRPVNFYMAYYASQRKGASVHSPRSCIPGGGWQIKSLTQQALPFSPVGSTEPLSVNRLIIQKGEVRQLVYYWFQQRERIITNEYAAKWYIFWDSLTKNRTDGALVRVTSIVGEGEDIALADQYLQEFVMDFVPLLPSYIPGA